MSYPWENRLGITSLLVATGSGGATTLAWYAFHPFTHVEISGLLLFTFATNLVAFVYGVRGLRERPRYPAAAGILIGFLVLSTLWRNIG